MSEPGANINENEMEHISIDSIMCLWSSKKLDEGFIPLQQRGFGKWYSYDFHKCIQLLANRPPSLSTNQNQPKADVMEVGGRK